MLERICDDFENHFEKRGDFHEKLLQRLALDLPNIRPAFVPADAVADARELKGFRRILRHAYDLSLRPDRLGELSAIAQHLAAVLPKWCADFEKRIRAEQGWS